MGRLKKRVYLGLGVALFLGIGAAAGGIDAHTFDWLYSHAREVDSFIAQQPFTSGVLMVGVYWVVLGLGLPAASLLSIVSGYFFGVIDGAFVATFGLLGSAAFTYWLGRTYVYKWLYAHHKERLGVVKKEVDENGPFYVLAVRLSTIFPFFWVNLLFGASGLRWRHYIWPTFLGLIPGSALFLHVGSTLASLDSISGVLGPKMAGLFVGLGLVALLPVLFRRFVK